MEQKYAFQYETEANASFYVGVLAEDVNVVQYQLKMLENNALPHLLEIRKYQTNNTVRLCYNVTGKLSLAQLTERQKLKKTEFLQLLNMLLESARELSEYQLPLSGLVLDENSVFVKPGSMEADFVYLPIFSADNGLANIRAFVQKMILDSRISISNDNFVQKLLELFNETDLTLESLTEKLSALAKPDTNNARPVEPRPVPVPVEPIKPPVFEPVPPAVAQPAPEPLESSAEEPPAPRKKNGQKTPKKAKAAKNISAKGIIFAVVQVVLLALIVLAAVSGFFLTEEGALNPSYIAGVLILVGGLDFVLYREMFVNNQTAAKPKKGETKAKKNIKKSPKKHKSVRPAAPPAAENRLAAAEAPAPAPQEAPKPYTPPVQPAQPPLPAYMPLQPEMFEPDDWDKTVIDDDSLPGEGYLEYYDNGLVVRIHLHEGVVRVGSHPHSVDHVLPSKRVSKVHADFIQRGNQFFVRDINSTNGTYLNGSTERLVSNQDYELHNGCKVRLANIEMVFKC